MACAVTASTRGDSRNTPRGYGWVGGSPAWWTDGAWCERITPDSPSEIFKAVGHHYHCERVRYVPAARGRAVRARRWRQGRHALRSNACRQAAYRDRKCEEG